MKLIVLFIKNKNKFEKESIILKYGNFELFNDNSSRRGCFERTKINCCKQNLLVKDIINLSLRNLAILKNVSKLCF